MLWSPLEDAAELSRDGAARVLGSGASPALAHTSVCLSATAPVLGGPFGAGRSEKWHLVTGTGRRDETREVAKPRGLLWVPTEGLCLTSRVWASVALFFSPESNIRAIKKSTWKSDSGFLILPVSCYCVAFQSIFSLYQYRCFVDFVINDGRTQALHDSKFQLP